MTRKETRAGAALLAITGIGLALVILLVNPVATNRPLTSRHVLQQQATDTPNWERSTPTPSASPPLAPYPPPYYALTPAPIIATRTPDPTRAAMSNSAWAQLMVDLATVGDEDDPYQDGPFAVIETADIFPGSMSEIRDDQIMADTVPDVGVILSGHFRSWMARDTHMYNYLLMVGDRTRDNGYWVRYADDLETLHDSLP